MVNLREAWQRVAENEVAQQSAVPNEPTITIQLTKKELTILRGLVQSAMGEMVSDPNSGVKSMSSEISNAVKKLDVASE